MARGGNEFALFIEIRAEAVEGFPVAGLGLRHGVDFHELVAVLGEQVGEVVGELETPSAVGWKREIAGDGHPTIEWLVVHSLSGKPFVNL